MILFTTEIRKDFPQSYIKILKLDLETLVYLKSSAP
jgi:hypothetical protein